MTPAEKVLQRLDDIKDDVLPVVEKLINAKSLQISAKEEAGREPRSVRFTMQEWYSIADCLQFLYCNADAIRAALQTQQKGDAA